MFVSDINLSFSKSKTDIDSSRSWRLVQGKPVIFQNSYDHTGTKKSVVWKYFGFIEAKDGPATKTNLNMTKALFKLYWKSHDYNRKSYQ